MVVVVVMVVEVYVLVVVDVVVRPEHFRRHWSYIPALWNLYPEDATTSPRLPP